VSIDSGDEVPSLSYRRHLLLPLNVVDLDEVIQHPPHRGLASDRVHGLSDLEACVIHPPWYDAFAEVNMVNNLVIFQVVD